MAYSIRRENSLAQKLEARSQELVRGWLLTPFRLVVNPSKFAGLRDFHRMPVANLKAKNALGNSSTIALTRAGLEVGALGAKSTVSGLPDLGLCVPSDPLD
jgi:hypothetical protein